MLVGDSSEYHELYELWTGKTVQYQDWLGCLVSQPSKHKDPQGAQQMVERVR